MKEPIDNCRPRMIRSDQRGAKTIAEKRVRYTTFHSMYARQLSFTEKAKLMTGNAPSDPFDHCNTLGAVHLRGIQDCMP